MNKKQGTIFTRILFASVAPFACVFALALLVILNIIYQMHSAHVREGVVLLADKVIDKIDDDVMAISSLLRLTAINLSHSVDNSAEGRQDIDETLHAFMNAHAEIHCAWFVFKPMVAAPDARWYVRAYIKRDGGIRRLPPWSRKMLDDPDISPWHTRPYNTGAAYFDTLNRWDYGLGDGSQYVATISYPILRDGMIIGTVGMDILYRDAFAFLKGWLEPGRRNIHLIAGNGDIITSGGDGDGPRNMMALGFRPADMQRMMEAMRSRETLLHETWSPLFRENALAYLRPLHGHDSQRNLYVYLSSPVSYLYSDIRAVIFNLLLIFFLGLTTLTATVYYATNSVVKPLKRIAGFAENIVNNRLDSCPLWVNVGNKGGHEVEVLSASIRNMLEYMEQNHQLKLMAVGAEYEKQKTEEASRARTQFFANMSHELRTPMNAIVGMSDILLEEDMPERQRNYLRHIKASSEALLVIIDDILDISKMESGKFKLVNSHFSLTRMLDNVAHMASHLAQGKGLAFSLEKGEGTPEYIYGDEVRIRQILLNLLGNAVKFTETGSVRLRVAVEKDCLVFAVIDTGIGIHPDERGDLFNAFRQVDTRRNRNIKGAGLGLSITMTLTRLMEGDIELESEYGKGSTFRVRLPLVRGEAALAPDEDAKEEGEIRKTAKIMVVDDNAINRKVAEGVFALFGLSCDLADSGAAALAMAAATDYDIVFMDHMMPEMDGVETTQRLREMGGRWLSVPIIAFTANTLDGAKHQLLSAGMNDFLAKPLRKDALRRMLLKWIPEGKPTTTTTAIRARSRPREDPLSMARRIAGLDVDCGLERAGGDGAAYLERLRETRETLIAMLDRMDGRVERLTRHDHAVLVRVLGDIGAGELAAHAASLEDCLHDDSSANRRRLEGWVAAVRDLCVALRQLPL